MQIRNATLYVKQLFPKERERLEVFHYTHRGVCKSKRGGHERRTAHRACKKQRGLLYVFKLKKTPIEKQMFGRNGKSLVI